MKTYRGGCHCGLVAYRVTCNPESALECNCSHCQIKGLLLTFVPKDQFTLEKGEEILTEYRFNTKKIQHLFCNKCGVESFARGRDNEDKEVVCINLRCLHDFSLENLPHVQYNGKDV